MTEKTRQYHYGVGKRKTAIACVKIFEEGSGKVSINGLPLKDYFSGIQIENAVAPLKTFEGAKLYDIEARVTGGGKEGQSDAVRHGVSRALLLINPDLRSELKHAGYLRRDARIKERKKPGLKRARRAPQWKKR